MIETVTFPSLAEQLGVVLEVMEDALDGEELVVVDGMVNVDVAEVDMVRPCEVIAVGMGEGCWSVFGGWIVVMAGGLEPSISFPWTSISLLTSESMSS